MKQFDPGAKKKGKGVGLGLLLLSEGSLKGKNNGSRKTVTVKREGDSRANQEANYGGGISQ